MDNDTIIMLNFGDVQLKKHNLNVPPNTLNPNNM